MTVLYVKNGAWSGNAPLYSSIDLAFDAAAAGDTIKVSDAHLLTTSAAAIWAGVGTVDNPINVLCVSDADVNVLSTGAKEGSSSQSTKIEGSNYFYGITIEHTQDVELSTNQSLNVFEKCGNIATGSGAGIVGKSVGSNTKFKDFVMKSNGSAIELYTPVSVCVDNISFDSSGSTPTYLFNCTTSNSVNIFFNNSDISNIALPYIVNGSNIVSEIINIAISRIKINAATSISDGSPFMSQSVIDAYSVDTGSGYHYFESLRYSGKWLESLTSYRDNGSLYDNNNSSSHYSCEVQTNANVVEFSNPLKVKLPAKKVDLTAGAVTLTVHIIQRNGTVVPTNLNDKNCILRAIAPDSTDTALGVEYKSSTKDILSTATDLSASTEVWTTPADGANEVKQQVSVTIPQNTQPGMDGAIIQLYLDVSKDLVNEDSGAGEIFVDFAPVVS